MNKILQIALFILIYTQSFGQGLTEKYSSFDVGLVAGTLNFTGSDLNLNFSENSIRELEYSFDKKLDAKHSYNAIKVGFKWGKYSGLSYSLFMHAALGDGKNKFGMSVGYNYPIEVGIFDILIRPSIAFSGVNSTYEIGTTKIDTFGIVIDDTDYVDRTLNIAITNSTCYVTPKIETTFLIEQKFGISLSAAYDIPFNSSEQDIDFKAEDFDSTSLPFDSEFHNFTVDGITPTGDIFTYHGIVYSLGISWYYNRE
ncbi:MAG: hypothetical protein ACI86M_001506 [Saprospiraceae bacterium]|jgi:hypothetical protein